MTTCTRFSKQVILFEKITVDKQNQSLSASKFLYSDFWDTLSIAKTLELVLRVITVIVILCGLTFIDESLLNGI